MISNFKAEDTAQQSCNQKTAIWVEGTVVYNDVVIPAGLTAGMICGVRPALTVDLSSVLFTSAAAGGDAPSASGTLSIYTVPAAAEQVKLTMKDSTQTLTIGTSKDAFSPAANIARADYLVLLIKHRLHR